MKLSTDDVRSKMQFGCPVLLCPGLVTVTLSESANFLAYIGHCEKCKRRFNTTFFKTYPKAIN